MDWILGLDVDWNDWIGWIGYFSYILQEIFNFEAISPNFEATSSSSAS